jgi:hypothetical protein
VNARPTISIIIPAFNAQATIGSCLDAINAAKRQGDEVIMFDDGATDDTNAIAKAAGVKILCNKGAPLLRRQIFSCLLMLTLLSLQTRSICSSMKYLELVRLRHLDPMMIGRVPID